MPETSLDKRSAGLDLLMSEQKIDLTHPNQQKYSLRMFVFEVKKKQGEYLASGMSALPSTAE